MLGCRELGGYKEIPIMEDYEMVQRLRKHSAPAIIPHALTTSGRRWKTTGFLRTTLINQVSAASLLCSVLKTALVATLLVSVSFAQGFGHGSHNRHLCIWYLCLQ